MKKKEEEKKALRVNIFFSIIKTIGKELRLWFSSRFYDGWTSFLFNLFTRELFYSSLVMRQVRNGTPMTSVNLNGRYIVTVLRQSHLVWLAKDNEGWLRRQSLVTAGSKHKIHSAWWSLFGFHESKQHN